MISFSLFITSSIVGNSGLSNNTLLTFGFFFIDDIKTGCLWVKGVSKFTPDYYVEYYEDSPWIHQPMEEYEDMNIQEVKKKIQAQDPAHNQSAFKGSA